MLTVTVKPLIQGFAIIMVTTGGIYYSASQGSTPPDGCIEYITVDGTRSRPCGQSATTIIEQGQAPQTDRKRDTTPPSSTASIKPARATDPATRDCLARQRKGYVLDPFCKLVLALDDKP